MTFGPIANRLDALAETFARLVVEVADDLLDRKADELFGNGERS